MKNLFGLYVVVSTQNKSLGLEYDVKVVFSSRSTFIFLVSPRENITSERVL